MRYRSLLVTIVGLFFSGCGEDAAPVGSAGDDASPCGQTASVADGDPCVPRLPNCWTPTWRPPKAPIPHACTESQILQDLTKCFGDSFDPDCEVFERDPANSACLGCIFSTFDEPSYGAIVLMSNGSWL